MSDAEEESVQQQLTFKLQELPSSGREWLFEIPRSAFEDAGIGSVEPQSRLCQDVAWNGSVISKGELFVLAGAWHIVLTRHCVRCNAEFPLQMDGEFNRYFQLGSSGKEPDESDSCEFISPPGLVNLVDVIREEVWLAWKPMVVCSELCKGLCQQCGENLNEGECACSRTDENHPFAALSKIRFDT